MKKFNQKYNTETTYAKINGEWRKVKEIDETRQWIKVHGVEGSFQRGHVEKFSNKEKNND